MVITKTPRKSQSAAIRMAFLGEMDLVDTQVAMAFGASVQPLTITTPSVSSTVMASVGLEISCERKSASEIVIVSPFPVCFF